MNTEFEEINGRSDATPPKKKGAKGKSSYRLTFEAQVQVIKNDIGDLEEVRKRLDLSRRKICQLLMVDPSAWTRWTRKGEDAPPHIYRALQWYLLTNQKYPGLGTPYWLSSVSHGSTNSIAGAKATLEKTVHAKNEALNRQIEELRGELMSMKQQLSINLSLEKSFERQSMELRAQENELSRLKKFYLGARLLSVFMLFLCLFLLFK